MLEHALALVAKFRNSSALALTCAAATAAVLVFGLYAMLQAPQVPYADAWRFLTHFLTQPFPRNVLGADNGHLELFPDLVRVAELEWFAANQHLQTAVGIALALGTWALAVGRLRREVMAPERFWALALVLALGLFWLGNFRALAHANETVHAYAVTLGLVAGLRLAWRGGVAASIAAGLCGVFASLSFGSGLAVFPALLLVLALRRAAWRDYLPIAASMMAVLLLMLALRDGTADSVPPPDLVGLLDALMRWLGGPVLFASWPLWDPELAQLLPTAALRGALLPLALGYEQAAGPVMLARWPHLGWGWLGLAGFVLALVRCWRAPNFVCVSAAAVAAFALCVGALIVLVRASYFEAHPDQLLAPRYVVWSSLFWAGLCLALVDALKPARAAQLALILGALCLPSQLWMAQLADRQQQVAERSALAAAVGVLPPELPLGETVFEDLAEALPLLSEAGAAMFVWPETPWLERAPDPAQLRVLAPSSLQIRRIENRLGPPGRRVAFELAELDVARLLLIDADGIVRGLARREPDGRWLGWMRGVPPSGHVRVAVLYER